MSSNGLHKGAHGALHYPSRAGQTLRTRPSLRRLLVAALILLGLLGTLGAFEYTVWHIPADRFTFVVYDANGNLIAHVARNNAREADAFRQQVNAQFQSDWDEDPVTGCAPNPGIIMSFRYDFFWRGFLVETVWSQNTECPVGWESGGGVTFEVIGFPIAPPGVHLPS